MILLKNFYSIREIIQKNWICELEIEEFKTLFFFIFTLRRKQNYHNFHPYNLLSTANKSNKISE